MNNNMGAPGALNGSMGSPGSHALGGGLGMGGHGHGLHGMDRGYDTPHHHPPQVVAVAPIQATIHLYNTHTHALTHT